MTMQPTSQTISEENAAELLDQMTLAEKIGQMTQVEKNSITPEKVREHFIGSVLSGGGGNPTPNTPEAWAAMVRDLQEAALTTRLAIPLIYGADAVHGHSNVRGAVIFPHNIGLGATRDLDLVAQTGRITARELVATGVHWNFAPMVAVPQDIRWGRTYEGFSEDTELVSKMGAAYLQGLQGANYEEGLEHPLAVLGSVKHFVGDGGTAWKSSGTYDWIDYVWNKRDDKWSIDQGITDIDEATLRALHLAPYKAAIAAGARNIMVSYSSWGGLKMHAQSYLLNEVLKKELGFSGFLVSDWLAIQQIDPDYYTCVVTSINAGLDMIMVPFDYPSFIQMLNHAVEEGDVPIARIDDAVQRILQVKFEMGLFKQPFGDDALLAEVGRDAHRQVARKAVRKSLVLLKDQGKTLPLSKQAAHIYVAGQAADDIGMQCGGWTIEWQGQPGTITEGTTILEGIKSAVAPHTVVLYDPVAQFESNGGAEVGIAVIGELPYAEGEGDQADLSISAEDVALIARLAAVCKQVVVIIISGRPLIITEIVDQCDALIAAWLPGSEGSGVADVLFGDAPFVGQLPYTWPADMQQVPLSGKGKPLFPFGHGMGLNS